MLNIESDSRKVKAGDIFIALRCEEGDGHNYIQQAIDNGASKIIAEEGKYNIDYLIVKDTRKYLIKYLEDNYGENLKSIKIIGITGTNGKSTTAFLLYDALNKLGIKSSYMGTIGFYIDGKVRSLPNTTPDTLELYKMFLESKEAGCKYIIQEVSSEGLLKRVEGYKFDYAIFTNLTQDHLNTHKTMENYALAKQTLFKKLKPTGIAIVNIDDKYKDYYLLDSNRNITYGQNISDYQISNYKIEFSGIDFEIKIDNKTYNFSSSLIGTYNIYNLLCAIIVLIEEKIDISKIIDVIKKVSAPAGRMDIIPFKESKIIVDYAHSPDAMINIMGAVKDFVKGDIYAVFGCTGNRDKTKRPIMMDIGCSMCKSVILTNDDPHDEEPSAIISDMIEGSNHSNYEVCIDRKKAIIKGIDLLGDGDVLLILGKGHEEFMVIGKKRVPFNDKKVVEEYIENQK